MNWFKRLFNKYSAIDVDDIFEPMTHIEVTLNCKCGYKSKYLFMGNLINKRKFICPNCKGNYDRTNESE